MNIGTVAERSGVSPKAIRYYESIGLVRPVDRRPNGYRSYTLVDMRTLDFIKRARSLGFSVEEVRELLDLWQNRSRRSAAVKALTSRHLEVLDRKIEELMTIRKALADLVKRCHGDARPDCPILDDFEHGEEVPHKAASPVEHRPRSRRHKEKS
jgi:MerR family copper efflux transcriptional regulator